MRDRARTITAAILESVGWHLKVSGQWLIDLSERIDLPFPPITPDDIRRTLGLIDIHGQSVGFKKKDESPDEG